MNNPHEEAYESLPDQALQRVLDDLEWWRRRLEGQPHNPIEEVVAPPAPQAPRPAPHPSKVSYMSKSGEIFSGPFPNVEPGNGSKVVNITSTDEVYRPKHYTSGGIEAIDFIRAKLGDEGFVAYCVGNALKYLSRAGKKHSKQQDLEKANVYMGWAIQASLGKELIK